MAAPKPESYVGAKPVEENDLVLKRLKAHLASGAHPKLASERLGHKDRITLDLYSHVMPGMQEDAAARVDAALQAAKKHRQVNGSKAVARARWKLV
jgi:hypothetical protein